MSLFRKFYYIYKLTFLNYLYFIKYPSFNLIFRTLRPASTHFSLGHATRGPAGYSAKWSDTALLTNVPTSVARSIRIDKSIYFK